jgi:hypothetical protein
MFEWQDMGTAPKDGTRVLVVWENFEGKKEVRTARYFHCQYITNGAQTGESKSWDLDGLRHDATDKLLGWQLPPSIAAE